MNHHGCMATRSGQDLLCGNKTCDISMLKTKLFS